MAFLREGQVLAALCALLAVVHGQIGNCNQPASDHNTLYDFSMLDITKNRTIPLSDYQGQVVLVVNVATY